MKMKFIKYLTLCLTAMVIMTISIGFCVINRKLTPAPNYLQVSDESDEIPIFWWQDASSEIAALLLPVRLRGINRTFYMQFDLGSPSTIFHRHTLSDLERHIPDLNFQIDSTNHLSDFSFEMGKITITAPKFRTINYGASINWTDSTSLNIIGTIGSDLIEKKLTLLDFINNTCHFGNLISATAIHKGLIDFSFKYRRVFFPAMINGENRKLWYDTGSSAFELLTSKATWKRMAKPEAKPVSHEVNSWGSPLMTHTIETDGIIQFDTTAIKLQSATYVEGHSFLQKIIARTTGMGGMIGNKIFMDKQVLIDCKNRKFGVFDHDIHQITD